MLPKKVIYIISSIHKSFAFEWLAIRLRKEVDLEFILLNSTESEIENFLIDNKIKVHRVKFRGARDYPLAFFRVLKILYSKKPDIVHTHLFDADFIGIISAWLLRIEKRIYTRHNSSLYYLYYPKVHFAMKIVNMCCTHIVSISKVTTEFMIHTEKVKTKKIIEINHGFDFDFINSDANKKLEETKAKYFIPDNAFIIGAISRFVDWKGIEYIIKAFRELRKSDQNYFLILANANGYYKEQILKELEDIPKNAYLTIPFEENVFSLYKLFDVFVHVPINASIEAFGQTYIESMILEVPMVCTLSGIGNEIIVNKKNALVVDYKNHLEIIEAIKQVRSNNDYKQKLTDNAYKTVSDKFTIEKMQASLIKLYS